MIKGNLKIKLLGLISTIGLFNIYGIYIKLSSLQLITLSAFLLSILGTLLFWAFRLSFAFLGSAILLFCRVVTLDEFIHYSSMEIIFFLIGMMIIAGFLKEIGAFNWLLQRALIMKNLTARKFMFALVVTSALSACIVDEVSSILLMIMIIIEMCEYFEVKPIPFIMASVLATNIGSAGTVIGNPIGLLIATKAGLTFEDFLRFSFPLMIITLFILNFMLNFIFRKELDELDSNIKRLGANEFLVTLLSVPAERKVKIGFAIFISTILFIALHHRFEVILGLETNTILLIAPLLAASIIMIWRRDRARSYIERDVEWWTLLFFIFLFAQAGIMAHTGVAEALAKNSIMLVAKNKFMLIGSILFGGAFVSSALDNVVVVAGSIPILQGLGELLHTKGILWWALLFGACFGGNITVVGSTANIMAVGTLERMKKGTIGFGYWLKIGFLVGVVTLAFIFVALMLLPWYR
ncbi:MAG: SLC13 family permease [Candidatus Omnitrophota bacterium]